jgi:hypothetical protein
MDLVQLVYFSHIPAGGAPVDIAGILRSARRHNARQHITGMLNFRDDFFLQLLEGERDAVNETYSRIIRDPRHWNVVLIGYQPAVQRIFPAWSMHWVADVGDIREVIMRYSASDHFRPDKMSFDCAIAFMQGFAAWGQRRSADAGAQLAAGM